MLARLSIILSLFVLTIIPGMSQTLIENDPPPASKQEAELAPEEEREAREMAVRFMKRLRETDDFDPLVSEFFVSDFVERIRLFVRAENSHEDFFVLCEREVLLQASVEDLRRAYLALMNFWNQQDRLNCAAWDHVKVQYRTEGKDALQEQEAWGQHLKLREEAVSEEAFRIAQSDPMLDSLFNLVREDKDGDDEESLADDDAKITAFAIHDVTRLRAFTDKLERTIPLLRRGAEKLRADIAPAHGASEKSQADELNPEDDFRIYHFESERLETETFGLPAGTMLIRARIYPYEMALARVDGQLKILAVYPDFDGD